MNFSYDWLPIWMTLNIEIPIAHIISMGSESSVIRNLISKVYINIHIILLFIQRYKLMIILLLKNPIIVGNGFKLDNYIFQENKNGPLAWVGRVAPEKGLEDAVYVAE